jgi:hypothetical protein
VALTTGVRVEHNDAFGTAVVPRLSRSVLRTGGGVLDHHAHGQLGRGVKEPCASVVRLAV